ncbi:MAG: Asp-tRNA(Asn)/Glu-tRNA(Gln) amidotransferase subunit GatA [Planctomycetota bacterium]
MLASDAARRVVGAEASAEEVVRDSLEAIGRRDGDVAAFLDVHHDAAAECAAAVDAQAAELRGQGLGAEAIAERLPMAGVPIAIKDNICQRVGTTTCASRMLEGYRSPFDATVIERLLAAGAVPVGKVNMDEFAMGSSCEQSAFGCTSNPWDGRRVPGGSSGGSAAAVAARMTPVSLGSDTGGSIRQPAGFCGVVGFKPTYGRVSRFGLVAFASSLDQIGPIGTTVEDVAMVTEVIAGFDERDATSAREAALPGLTRDVRAAAASRTLKRDGRPVRIGVVKQGRSSDNDPAVTRAIGATASRLERLGAELIEVDLPMTDHGIAAYYVVAMAEASSNLARFDGVRYGHRGESDDLLGMYMRSRSEGFGPEVQRRIMLGTHVLSSGYYDAYYNRALKARRLIKRDYDRAFGKLGCAALLMPTSPGPAFEQGSKSSADADQLALYLEDVYTVGVNLAGLPAISMPGGMAEVDGKRLPVGVQLIGPAFADRELLCLAAMLEAAGAKAEEPAAG